MEDLTDDEIQHLADLQYHDELSAYVATLPPASPDMERDYQTKMEYLESIRNELNLPSPEEEGQQDYNNIAPTYDSRYCYEYSLTHRGKIMYRQSAPFSLNFPKYD